MSFCKCGDYACQACHPEMYRRNKFGRVVFLGEQPEQEIDDEDKDISEDVRGE